MQKRVAPARRAACDFLVARVLQERREPAHLQFGAPLDEHVGVAELAPAPDRERGDRDRDREPRGADRGQLRRQDVRRRGHGGVEDRADGPEVRVR